VEHRRNRFRSRDLDVGPRQPSPRGAAPSKRSSFPLKCHRCLDPLTARSSRSAIRGVEKGSTHSAGHVRQGHFRRETGLAEAGFRAPAEGIFQWNPVPSPPPSFGRVPVKSRASPRGSRARCARPRCLGRRTPGQNVSGSQEGRASRHALGTNRHVTYSVHQSSGTLIAA
jgi:hypothetical protein